MASELSGAPKPWWKSWRSWVGVLIGGACLFWLVRALDWPQVFETLSAAHYGLVGGAVFIVLVTFAVRTLRWAVLVRPASPSPLHLLTALVVGQVTNYAIPARAGDIARAYVLGSLESESSVQVLGTVAVEKVWDLVMVLLLALLLSTQMSLPFWLSVAIPGVSAAVLLGLVGAFVSRRWKNQLIDLVAWVEVRIPGAREDALSQPFLRLLDGLGGLQEVALAWRTFLLSAIIWGLGVLVNWLVLKAVGLSPSPLMASFLMVALMLGVTVPTLPGQVGYFEGICIVSLALWGIERNAAFSAGLLLHAVVYIPPVVLALLLGAMKWPSLVRALLRGEFLRGHLADPER